MNQTTIRAAAHPRGPTTCRRNIAPCAEVLERRVLLAAASDLDPSFANAGLASIDASGSATEIPVNVVRQSDGKLLIPGQTEHDAFLVRLNANGTLDSTFGSGGKVLFDSGMPHEYFAGVLILGNGYLAYGFKASTATSTSSTMPFVAKFSTSGQIDTSYGTNGIVTFTSSPNVSYMAAQPDGKIVIGGFITGALKLSRYLADGTPDSSFGSGGTSTDTSLSNTTYNLRGLAVQPADGKVVAVLTPIAGSFDYGLVRYSAAGVRETSGFGTAGLVSANLPTYSYRPKQVLVQSDGKIDLLCDAISGFTPFASGITRHSSTGELDSSFDGDGYRTMDAPGVAQINYTAIAVDGSGRIVAVGFPSSSTLMATSARLTTAGAFDSSYDGDGVAQLPNTGDNMVDRGTLALAVLPDNSIVAAGEVRTPQTYFNAFDGQALHFTSGGSFDASFGTNGVTNFTFNGPTNSRLARTILTAAGKLVFVGSSQTFNAIQYTRLGSNGSPDPTFGTGGTFFQQLGYNDYAPLDAIVQSDGKLVSAGYIRPPGPGLIDNNIQIARVNADGSTDTSFGASGPGYTGLDLGPGNDVAFAVAQQPLDGSLLALVGHDTANTPSFYLVRFTSAGVWDQSFGTGGKVQLPSFDLITFGPLQRLLVQPNGSIMVVGSMGGDITVGRLSSTGAGDPAFGTNGWQTVDLGGASDSFLDAAVVADGSVSIAGNVNGSASTFAVAKLTAAGHLDSTFNGTGKATVALAAGRSLRSIFVEGDGRILAVGTAGSGAAANLLAGRLTSQGAADTAFGQGGFATFDVTPGATNWGGDQGFFVAQLADGKILLAGQGASESTNADFIAARLIGDQFATINGRILTVAGSAAADAISLTFTASSVNAVLNGSTASFDLGDFDSIQIDAGAANDALTISAPAAIAQPLSFIGGAGSNTLSINSGVLAIANDLGQSSSSTAVSVASGATVTFAASEHLIGLDVSGTAVLGANGTSRLVTSSLSIAAGGLLDLGDNDLLLDYTGASQLAAVQQLINAARAGGSWTGKGLGSSAARNSPQHNTTLGAMESSEYQSIYGPGASFDGEPLDATMILAKYTWYGDADFNGRVNFDDYVHIDSGFNNHRSGWTNGDFDGNGQVNFDDYVLIDLAFNTQSGTL